jgi:hypothetical protein
MGNDQMGKDCEGALFETQILQGGVIFFMPQISRRPLVVPYDPPRFAGGPTDESPLFKRRWLSDSRFSEEITLERV